VDFEIIDEIRDVETIAVNTSIRDLDRLKKMYGKGRWRKVKGVARVRLKSGRRLMQTRRTKRAHPNFVACVDNSGVSKGSAVASSG
jgi:hypothetical protein